MNKPAGVRWLASTVAVAVIAVAAYAMGKGNIDPSSIVSAFGTRTLSALPADSTTMAKAVHGKCGKLGGQAEIACYTKPLDSLAAAGDVLGAMSLLGEIQKLDVDARRDGHVYAHMIGITAGKRGGDVAKTFVLCNTSNQSGCYHGVIQAYFDVAKNVGPDEVNAVCQAFRGAQADQWLRFQCAHGVGHGLTMFYAHDLPKALTGCDFFSEDWDRHSCYGGAFMENIVNATMPEHPSHGLKSHDERSGTDMAGMDHDAKPKFRALDPGDLLYPCSIMADRYLVSCYEMQTSVMLNHNKGDIKGAATTCDTAPPRLRHVCYQSLGRDISAYSLQDPVKGVAMCSLGTPRFQPWCFVGLVKNLVDLNARSEDGMAFCKTLTGESNKLKCYEAVGEQIGTLRNEPTQRRALCEAAEPDFVDTCQFGARLGVRPPDALIRYNAATTQS
ncbi:MAG: hypothetical protein ABIR58_00010 [Gemmatimonadaceae bacterium]